MLTGKSHYHPCNLNALFWSDDDSASGESERNVKDIGTICMEFYRVDAESIKDTGFYKARPLDIENRPVHERTKKAGCHRVRYVRSPVPKISTHDVISQFRCRNDSLSFS